MQEGTGVNKRIGGAVKGKWGGEGSIQEESGGDGWTGCYHRMG